jgi:hypothetical protein
MDKYVRLFPADSDISRLICELCRLAFHIVEGRNVGACAHVRPCRVSRTANTANRTEGSMDVWFLDVRCVQCLLNSVSPSLFAKIVPVTRLAGP